MLKYIVLKQIHQQGGNHLRLENIKRTKPELKQGSTSMINFKKRKNRLLKLRKTKKALQKTLKMIESEEYKYYQSLYDKKREKNLIPYETL